MLTCYKVRVVTETSAQGSADERLGANLRIMRERLKISQSALAEVMTARGFPWHQSTVARTEAGKQAVRIGEVEALAAIFGISVERLLGTPEEAEALAAIAQAAQGVRGAAEIMAHVAQRQAEARAAAVEVVAKASASEYKSVRDAAAKLAELLGIIPE